MRSRMKEGLKTSAGGRRGVGRDVFDRLAISLTPKETVDDLINNTVQTIMDTAGGKSERGEDFWKANEQQLLRALMYYITRSAANPGKRTIKELMRLLLCGTAVISQVFAGLDESDPAFTPSSNFRGSEERIRDSARTGLSGHLQIFETVSVHECLSYNTIKVEDAVKRPTAIFIVTPDFKEEYDVITSLFVSHVYTKLTEIADSRPSKKLERPFFIIVDEICNMAAINSFSKIISTNRSRNIHFMFAIQSAGQLEERYGRLFENILANCGTVMFFGCGDHETAKMISERAGRITIVQKSRSMDANPLVSSRLRAWRGSVRVQTEEADLIPPAKARQLAEDELILCVAGKKVLRCSPYGEHMHPLSTAAAEAAQEEREKEAADAEKGFRKWPEWLKNALDEGYMKEPPLDNVFEVSDYEREKPAYEYAASEGKRQDGKSERKGFFPSERRREKNADDETGPMKARAEEKLLMRRETIREEEGGVFTEIKKEEYDELEEFI